MLSVSSDEEGEEILRQRGQFPALPFTASECGSPSPRSPRSPGSVSTYSNGSSPQAIPWESFSVNNRDSFKFPSMPQKYPSNGRVHKKKPPHIHDGMAKSPASGECFLGFFFLSRTGFYNCEICLTLSLSKLYRNSKFCMKNIVFTAVELSFE